MKSLGKGEILADNCESGAVAPIEAHAAHSRQF
jgi:hypothetical protein